MTGVTGTGMGMATESGEGRTGEGEGEGEETEGCSGVGEEGGGGVDDAGDLWFSRKHLEHMFMVEAEPKKPQPFAQGGGEGVPWSESPCPLSAIAKRVVVAVVKESWGSMWLVVGCVCVACLCVCGWVGR